MRPAWRCTVVAPSWSEYIAAKKPDCPEQGFQRSGVPFFGGRLGRAFRSSEPVFLVSVDRPFRDLRFEFLI